MTTPGTIHTRIDSRLLHGQVVQFWIPFLGVERLIIADDEVAGNPSLLAVYRLAAPENLAVQAVPVAELLQELGRGEAVTILVLLAEVSSVARARGLGFCPPRVVLGNVHAAPGRRRITDAVHLSPEETDALGDLVREGAEVLIQTLPGETLRLGVDEKDVPRWSMR
jgi:PTS system mannose-specific IIB component